MFEFFKPLRKSSVVEQKKRIKASKYYFPYGALVCGGDIARDYFIKGLVKYIKQNVGIKINPGDVSYCNDTRWKYLHNGVADVIHVYIDNLDVDNKVDAIVEYAEDYLSRFSLLHSNSQCIYPTNIKLEDLDNIGTVSGYVKFEDLPSFKDYKTIHPEQVSPYLKYVQQRANELQEFDDLDRMREFCKHYRFNLDMDSDRGFKWKITFLEIEPISIPENIDNIISKIADNLICDEYFIHK